MPCYSPISAYQAAESGCVVFTPQQIRGKGREYKEIQIPCNQCIGCRLERSRQWAMRIQHETLLHTENAFVTLTYGPDNLPVDGSLDHRHIQLFLKRLRKYVNRRIGYYMCGEYGENLQRPHYHMCLFGYNFPDRKRFKRSQDGYLYTSQILGRLWPYGFSLIGELNFKSAAYVARYCLKKVTGQLADAHYNGKKPEYARMSLRPAVGLNYLRKYKETVFEGDFIVVNGRRVKPPKYYDRYLKKLDPDKYDEVKEERELRAYAQRADNTLDRLLDKEEVQRRRLSLCVRHKEI